MTGLLEIRENLKSFYVKNEVYMNPLIKFLVALVALAAVNGFMGYMDFLTKAAIVLMIALACSFLPKNFIVIVLAAYVLLHSYALAIECVLVVLAVFAVMFFMYFRYVPRDTMVVLLTPLLFILKIPFVMPVALGLLATPASIISLSCGTIIYYIMKFMADNLTVFSATDAETGSQKLRIMLDGILDNKSMFATLIIFALTLVLVYALRRTAVNHNWRIAIFAGISVSVILLLVCEFLFELQLSVLASVIGGVVSLGICMVIEFLEFNVDYDRTEIVQFEDDEYYYYVKAVPKNVVSAPDKKVKRISRPQKKGPVRPPQRQEPGRESSAVRSSQPRGTKGQGTTTIKTANGVARSTVSRENIRRNQGE